MSLIAHDISKSFSGKTILHHFQAEFAPGISFIFAPNGAGKTTLLNILGGADRAYFGKLTVDGIDATADPERANRKRAYLPSDLRFYPGVSAHEFLGFIAQIRNLDAQKLLKSAKDEFGISNQILKQSTESLSLGQRKRLFLAATLLPELSYWILDEPTNGLDTQYREVLVTKLTGIEAAGKTIVIASHDLAVAQSLGVKPIQFDFCDMLPR